MRSDLKPNEIALGLYRQRPVPQAHPHRPKASDLFELQRWMLRIFLQQLVVFVGERANLLGEPVVSVPERAAREVLHSLRTRPSCKSRSASSASRSSRPSAASRSIFWSKRAASNCSNQARNRAS